MKIRYKIVLVILIIVAISACSSNKNTSFQITNNSSVKIVKAVYSDWIGGVEGVRGSTIEIVIDDKNVNVDTLYFRQNRIVPELKITEDNQLRIIGNIKKTVKPDLILHKDSKQEYINKVPVFEPKFPFELDRDELILSFTKEKKRIYLKIKLTKLETQHFK